VSSNKEILLSIVCIILTIGFILCMIAAKQEIKEYKKAYVECVNNLNEWNNGNNIQDVWGRIPTILDYENITIS
jgi:hypothetical protein